MAGSLQDHLGDDVAAGSRLDRAGDYLETRVAVLMRHSQQLTICRDESVVAASGIDTDRDDAFSVPLHRAARAFRDLAVKPEDVSERAAWQVRPGIVEAMDFLEPQRLEIRSRGDHPPAARAQINGDECFFC